ncbi:flagellar assembly protein FliH [Pantoea sp.]|uniref:flagellar assembly protein FliH n=1 Tax=Pantoea sp. TaxID=69393 RepID=UPI0031D91F20
MSSKQMRSHQFPPLRKPWQRGDESHVAADAATLQQQLMEGFQQGLSDGFAQGVEQGISQGIEQGIERGRSEGQQQGFDAGKQQALTHFAAAAAPLDSLSHQLQQQLEEHDQRRKSELLALVEKVTRQVIRVELALQPSQLLALVDEALSSLPALPTQLRVMLNAEEFSRIKELEPEKVKLWGLTADSEMEPGECRILTDASEMDIGCNQRLSQCMKLLQDNL